MLQTTVVIDLIDDCSLSHYNNSVTNVSAINYIGTGSNLSTRHIEKKKTILKSSQF